MVVPLGSWLEPALCRDSPGTWGTTLAGAREAGPGPCSPVTLGCLAETRTQAGTCEGQGQDRVLGYPSSPFLFCFTAREAESQGAQ